MSELIGSFAAIIFTGIVVLIVNSSAESDLAVTVNDQNANHSVAFYLFTRKFGSKSKRIYPGARNELIKLAIKKPIKFLVHGYIDNSYGPNLRELKSGILNILDVNVIKVDWSVGSFTPIYSNAHANTKAVGRHMAKMIDFLVEEGADIKDIHIIGHSLGAHISGFAALAVTKGRVSRISGLDPAGPGFYEANKELRLDASVADFVDCIHTCVNVFGIGAPICHVNFYPNRGVAPQPGCTMFDIGMCSHQRAVFLFAESVDPKHKFETQICDDFSQRLSWPKNCNKSSVLMGYYTDPGTRGLYYTETTSKLPYALKIDP